MNRKRSMCIKTQLIFLLSLILFFVTGSGGFTQGKRLTIDNKSVVCVRVYVEEDKQFYHNPIGFVEPGERVTFSYPLQLGRWYLKINPQTDTYPRAFESTLYVKQNENVYAYEVHDSHFSDNPISNPPNVSIVGTWANRNGLATEFQRRGEEYVGKIVAIPDSFAKFGYYSGMEWIKVKRVDFDRYKGTWISLDSDGNATNAKWSCAVEHGNELFPHNWFRQ